MDRYALPFLGRRRGWLVVTQVLLASAIAWMGTLSPAGSLWLLGAVALGVAFLSASQDIVFDAFAPMCSRPRSVARAPRCR